MIKTIIIEVLLFPFFAHAQLQVKGIAKTENGNPVPFASVLLLSSKDSTLVRGQVSNEAGYFSIATDEEGLFFVSVSAVGFHTETMQVFKLGKSNSPLDLGNITVRENVELLNEVVVKAEKPMFEQKIDRTIINVQSSISRAGGTALDVLQRSPGVSVDKLNHYRLEVDRL